MKSYKTILIVIFFIILNFFMCKIVYSDQMRNPFKDWFPVKIKEVPKATVIDDGPMITFEEEEEVSFDPSIYTVEGLIWGEHKPKAIIDDQIYTLGDRLDDAEIVKINKDGVTLIYDDQEYVVTTKQVINVNNSDAGEIQGVGNAF